jgi:ribonuclease BN (tRNA processing enzyme)
MTTTVRFIGSGDAFGDGGRFQACILVSDGTSNVLLDCGASSLVAMKQQGIEPNDIEHVVISHLHGDHFGGLPFLILDGQFRRRSRDLHVIGPPETAERLPAAMEALYPNSSTTERRFQVTYSELSKGRPVACGAAYVTGFEVTHGSGAPAFATRLELGGTVIGYSGDAEWGSGLVSAAEGTDLFICECYGAGRTVRNHIDYETLGAHRAELRTKRLILTHMGPAMLEKSASVPSECAHDGLVLEL